MYKSVMDSASIFMMSMGSLAFILLAAVLLYVLFHLRRTISDKLAQASELERDGNTVHDSRFEQDNHFSSILP